VTVNVLANIFSIATLHPALGTSW